VSVSQTVKMDLSFEVYYMPMSGRNDKGRIFFVIWMIRHLEGE
jgi:hypothetical protein